MNRRREPDPTDRYVGTQIRLRRMALKMSQAALAGALGLTFQQVQKYESGVNRVSASRLLQLAGILQVEPTHFFGDLQKPDTSASPSPDDMTKLLASPEGMALMQAFKRLPSKSLRQCVVALVQELGERET
jgi:transcriptional regulator with XRE-family HTH domain